MQTKNLKNINLKTLLNNLLKAFTLLVIIFLVLLSAAYLIFQIYKDDVTKALLLSLNSDQSGEIFISDISLAPFEHFPSISLKLDSLTLFEHKKTSRNENEIPILELPEVYIAINVLAIFKSHLNISEISVNGGSVFLKTYSDSSFNITNIFLKPSLDVDKKEKKSQKKVNKDIVKTDDQSETKLDLSISNLFIEDLDVILINEVSNNSLYFEIADLNSSFNHKKNSTNLLLRSNLKIDSLVSNSKLLFNNVAGSTDMNVNFNHVNSLLIINNSSILIGDSEFKFNGTYNPDNEGDVDLSIQADEKSTGIFSLILSEKGIANFKKGEFRFSAEIKGKTFNQLPNVNAKFDLRNVELLNPITNRVIKNLMLVGNFNSGFQNDFSDALLQVDTLSAELHTGHFAFTGSIKDFTAPNLDIKFDINADVTGLEHVFNITFIENLKGRIRFNDELKGKYDVEQKRFLSSLNKSSFEFEKFGMNIPGVIKFDDINGTIKREGDTYRIENLHVLSDDTDLFINGELTNINYLLFDIEKEIEANLIVNSIVFDLANFLAFDPSIKRDFPYRILNLDLSVNLTTTTSDVLNFKSFPSFNSEIKRLDATIEGFLPEIKIKSGKFKLSEDLLGFNLKALDFKTDFLAGRFNFSAEYNNSKFEPFYIKVNTSFANINPSLLFEVDSDTIPEFYNGDFSGSMFVDLQLPVDSAMFKFVNIKNADLDYKFAEDTIITKSLNLNISDVYFAKEDNSNPFASLTTKGKLNAKVITSNNFFIEDVKMNFDVTDGEYKVSSKQLSIFGKSARGDSYVSIKPFEDVPSIKIKYDVERFYAEEMLETFLEDTIISGPMSLSLELNSKGLDWESALENLNGNIKLTGREIIFYGIDADEIIDKFKRSQSFNFLDLGAVLLAGPVGIAVTKGSDFAQIFLFNDGVYSKLNNMVYNWSIESGVFNIEDAAFSTDRNRIATQGIIDFPKDSLDLTLAINNNGCSLFSQRMYGYLDSPAMENVKVVGTILAPVTNLIDDVIGSDCVVFYEGAVKHPER